MDAVRERVVVPFQGEGSGVEELTWSQRAIWDAMRVTGHSLVVGGIMEMPAPIHASNVMLLDPKSGDPTRTRRQIDEDGTKERIAVKSGEAIPRTR